MKKAGGFAGNLIAFILVACALTPLIALSALITIGIIDAILNVIK